MQGNEGQSYKAYRKQIANDRSPSLSVITSIVNGLDSPMKRQILKEWIKTHDPTVYCL